jgi:hypothetical protein
MRASGAAHLDDPAHNGVGVHPEGLEDALRGGVLGVGQLDAHVQPVAGGHPLSQQQSIRAPGGAARTGGRHLDNGEGETGTGSALNQAGERNGCTLLKKGDVWTTGGAYTRFMHIYSSWPYCAAYPLVCWVGVP